MKKFTSILAVVTGAIAIGAILLHRRKDGSRLGDTLLDSTREMGEKAVRFGRQIKDRLLHDVHGPNGEDVYADMYDRQFYEDGEGERIYLEEVKS